MRRVLAAAALGAISTVALFVSADAQPQPQAPSPGASKDNACFFQRDVSSFKAANEHTVYLRVGVNDYYRLDLISDCQNLDFALGLALQNRSGGPTICSPLDAELIVRQSGAPVDHCPVTAIHKLNPAEVLALGKNKP
jgi:hypothetical protein